MGDPRRVVFIETKKIVCPLKLQIFSTKVLLKIVCAVYESSCDWGLMDEKCSQNNVFEEHRFPLNRFFT